MSELTFQDIHKRCLTVTQQVINGFGWESIAVGVLSDKDKTRLAEGGMTQSVLNWPWALVRYDGNPYGGIFDISLKVTDYPGPDALHAVIICKYDAIREQFSLCMLENFIAASETVLNGRVFIIALIYATTFCHMTGLSDLFIQDPVPDALSRYRSYGFAQVWNDHDKMSATVTDVLQSVVRKVHRIDFHET